MFRHRKPPALVALLLEAGVAVVADRLALVIVAAKRRRLDDAGAGARASKTRQLRRHTLAQRQLDLLACCGLPGYPILAEVVTTLHAMPYELSRQFAELPSTLDSAAAKASASAGDVPPRVPPPSPKGFVGCLEFPVCLLAF